jgi:hypothetical protein
MEETGKVIQDEHFPHHSLLITEAAHQQRHGQQHTRES